VRLSNRREIENGTFNSGARSSYPAAIFILQLSAFKGKLFMIMFTETIAPPPPLAPLTDDEELKLIADLTIVDPAQEDRWVKDFIAHLAGVIQAIKH
jgi:hypothetical protein